MKRMMKQMIALTLALSLAVLLAAQSAQQGQKQPKGAASGNPAANYTIEQSISDQAQLSTIAFSALAFMTGTFGADTFMPPGKVADYFGFQYMRDVDIREAGHNQLFLGKIGNATLAILNATQKAVLLELAVKQEQLYQDLAKKRLLAILAFRQNMEGSGPTGNKGLSQKAVQATIADIFSVDGQLAYDRAVAYGKVANSLSLTQKTAFSKLAFGDSSTWPSLPDQYDKRTMSHGQDVLFLTYASEFFSWYEGNENADVYFCPERHGTYFGGFYMKDYPAMGNNDYYIPTALTGDSGAKLLSDILTKDQAALITGILIPMKPILEEILSIRRQISQEFRGVLSGKTIDYKKVMALSYRYGELDGLQSYEMATRIAAVYKTLSADQKADMFRLRNQDVFPKGYYLYSDPVEAPVTLDTSVLFLK